jgi:hypothetical protein
MIYFRAGALELLEGLRHEYYSCRAAKIQRTWRRTSNGSRDFRRFKRSIILLQAHVRTYFALGFFVRLKKAAKAIQFMRRSYILKTEYNSLKSGLIRLQQQYRLVSERHYRYARWISATKIQSMNRSWLLSSRYCRMKRGFLRLQAQHRANVETKHWNDTVRAALLINSICRTHVFKSRFERTRNGFVIFQAQYRGVCERRCQAQSRADLAMASQTEKVCAAVRIMGAYQTALARTRFSQMKLGFTRFQAHYRGVAERKRQDEYKMASTILTSTVRMYPHRVRYVRLVRSITIVQKRFRENFQSRADLVCAAVRIMGVYRTAVARSRFSLMKSGFIRLQAQHRGVAERKRQDEYKIASTIMTSTVRMYPHRVHYVRLVRAITIVQMRFRGKFQSNISHNHANPIATIQVFQQRLADEAQVEDGGALSLVDATTESTSDGLEAANKRKEDKGEEATTTSVIKDDGLNQNESHVQNYGTDYNKSNLESLAAQIKRLQGELECRNKEVADLRQEVAHVAEEAEIHTQEIEAEYEDRLAAYEEEVIQLKRELQKNQESHETKIERLMRDRYQQSEEYKNHVSLLSCGLFFSLFETSLFSNVFAFFCSCSLFRCK